MDVKGSGRQRGLLDPRLQPRRWGVRRPPIREMHGGPVDLVPDRPAARWCCPCRPINSIIPQVVPEFSGVVVEFAEELVGQEVIEVVAVLV